MAALSSKSLIMFKIASTILDMYWLPFGPKRFIIGSISDGFSVLSCRVSFLRIDFDVPINELVSAPIMFIVFFVVGVWIKTRDVIVNLFKFILFVTRVGEVYHCEA
jgi:hypothetical protein